MESKDFSKYSYAERRKALKESSDYRRWIGERLCQHLASGFSAKSFAEISPKALADVMQKHPMDFDFEALEAAEAEGMRYWESLGRDQSSGKCLGNSRAWSFWMSARYGWTTQARVETDVKQKVEVQVISYAPIETPPQQPESAKDT